MSISTNKKTKTKNKVNNYLFPRMEKINSKEDVKKYIIISASQILNDNNREYVRRKHFDILKSLLELL